MAKALLINYIGLLLPSLIFIIASIISAYMREGLFLYGLNSIYSMQQNSGPVLNFIENIFSMLGNPITIYVIIAAQFLYFSQRIRTVVHLIYLMGGLYFMVLLKQIFQQSRPFWYDAQINILEWFCPIDFGNPSGHSFIYIAMFEPLISDFVGTGRKKILLFVWAFLSIFVLISRMYLGAHSLDQVVYGGLIGLCYLVIYRFWLQNFLYETLIDLLNQKNKKVYGLITTILWLVFFIAPLVAYQFNVSKRPMSAAILSNLNKGCSINHDSQHYQRAILNSALASFVSFGFIYGFLFLKNKDRQDSLFMAGLWSYKDQRAFILYLLSLIVVVGLPALILILLLPKFIDSAQFGYTLKVLGATWAGFALIYPMSLVQTRFQLLKSHNDDQTQ